MPQSFPSYSLRPTHYRPRRRHPHCHPPYSCRAHHVGLIVSCCNCQLSLVSDTQSKATRITALLHVMIAAMDVMQGACAGNVKCGSSIYRCTLDIENRTGLSHYAWNPLHVCCNTRVFHQRHNRPGGHQQSITLERATLVWWQRSDCVVLKDSHGSGWEIH